MIELERKYLWFKLPNCQPTRILEIKQFYTLGRLRYREEVDLATGCKEYFQTFKKDSYVLSIGDEKFVGRNEDEISITFEDYQRGYDKCISNIVKKTRYVYKDATHVWSGDIFNHLIVGELELYSNSYLQENDKYYNEISKVIIPNCEINFTNFDISKLV